MMRISAGLQSFVIAAVIFVFRCGCEDTSYIFEAKIVGHPANATVVEGDSARLRCRIADLPLGDGVIWTVNGLAYGPWIPGYSQNGYSYPEDCDVSVDEYDMDINPVKWQEHAGSQFRCQLIKSSNRRIASNTATLTVIVPPSRLTITPASRGQIIHVASSAEAVNVTCETEFATRGSKITWTVDGKSFSGLDRFKTKLNEQGAELTKTSSMITLFSSANVSSKSSSGARTYKEEHLIEMLERRVNVDGLYRTAFQVVCHLSNPTLEAKGQKSKLVWVVFDAYSAENSALAQIAEGPFLWILVGIGGALLLLTVIAVAVGCRKMRRRKSQRRVPAPAHKNEGAMALMTDQGVCSSADSDKTSCTSTPRPWPVATVCQSNVSSACRDAGSLGEGVRWTDDHFMRGDCAAVVEGSTVGRPYPPSTRSDSSAYYANGSRDEAVRFFTRPSLRRSPVHRQENIEIVSIPDSDVYVHTFHRGRYNTSTVPDRRSKTDSYARGAFGTSMTAFGSLPRRDPVRRQLSAPAPEVSGDFPLPLAEGALDLPVPPPMPAVDYFPQYNVVSQCANLKSAQRCARSDAEAPFPASLLSEPADNASGSLV